VDSCPDALIHKARISIQIQPSRRQSAWSGRAFNRYGNYLFNFNRPDACLSWSRRALNRYGNCVLKINCPDGLPPGPDARNLIWKLLAAEVRPSGRQCLTVQTRLSNKEDFQRKSQNLWSHSCPSGRPMSTVRTALVVIKAVAHLNPQPINRGPWALRTAIIRY
jgi:hypothetical protein